MRRVGEHERAQFLRARRPVPEAQFLEPLKQAAIDEDPPAADLEQMLRSRDRSRRAENVSEDIR